MNPKGEETKPKPKESRKQKTKIRETNKEISGQKKGCKEEDKERGDTK